MFFIQYNQIVNIILTSYDTMIISTCIAQVTLNMSYSVLLDY